MASISRDTLTGALIGLARPTDSNEHLISRASTKVILEGLRSLGAAETELPEDLLRRITEEKRRMVPDCFTCAAPCGKNSDYDMEKLHSAEEEIRILKYGLLDRICCIAAREGLDAAAEGFLYKALIVIGIDGYGAAELRPILQEAEDLTRLT